MHITIPRQTELEENRWETHGRVKVLFPRVYKMTMEAVKKVLAQYLNGLFFKLWKCSCKTMTSAPIQIYIELFR